jgi:hypothetical protein
MYKTEAMNQTGVYNSMLYGGTLIGIAVMNWAASSAPSAADVRHVALGNLAAMVISLVIALVRQLTSGTAQPTGWVNVGIFLVFTVLFGYLYFSSASEPARERSAMRDAMGR